VLFNVWSLSFAISKITLTPTTITINISVFITTFHDILRFLYAKYVDD
jgi:hypothetical protein